MSATSAIWAAVRDEVRPSLVGGTLVRTVERQAQVATLGLVGGDLARQDALERLLERSKPPRRAGTDHLDYLLATPWRYPPLAHGSRFGARTEPSLLYGSLAETTSLAETAYYRLRFREDAADPPPSIASEHTLFEAAYRTERGVRLQSPPFAAHREALAHRRDYGPAQALGAALREAGVEAFEFVSARDPEGGINVALVSPAALVSHRHERPRDWACATTATAVTFRAMGPPSTLLEYRREDFLVDGELPAPAG